MLERLVPPALEPVTLAEVYRQLRLDPFDSPPAHPDDPMLLLHIATARWDAEDATRRSFVQQTLRLSGPSFHFDSPRMRWCGPGRSEWGVQTIDLLRQPISEIISVSYYDGENVLAEIEPEDYFLAGSRLMFAQGFALPSVYMSRPDAVQVVYRAGYPPANSPNDDYVSNVPPPIKQAILIGVQLLYDELTPEKRTQLEQTRDALLSAFVVHTIA